MKLRFAWITGRSRTKNSAVQTLTQEYLDRLARYLPVEIKEYPSEEALLKDRTAARTAPFLVLLDSGGKQLGSEELAELLRTHQDRGTQQLVFAIGPADGFTAASLKAAQQTLSLGKMTYPHELVRVLLAEQLYRACTILKGHPYHCGH